MAGDPRTVPALRNPVEFPVLEGVFDTVERFAAQDPDRPAVLSGGPPLGYGALVTAVGDAVERLRANGCLPGAVVACSGPRSATTLVLFLAIERMGAVYLPVDSKWPDARVADVLDRGRCALLVDYTDTEFVVRTRDAGSPGLADLAHADPRYVIFTSGTTGRPKGAVVAWPGMVNHLWAKVVDLDLTERDCVAFTAPLVFDIAIWQMLAPLLVGGSLRVVTDVEVRFPRRLRTVLADSGATVVELVPTAIGLLLDELDRGQAVPALRWLISTGEELKPALAERAITALPEVGLLNAYGPTECSDDVTHHVVTLADTGLPRLPVGRPIANCALYCLVATDGGWAPAEAGVTGEIFVGGVPVGLGYVGDPEATAAAFHRDPFDPASPTGRLYRTGDLGRVVDGVVHYHGRADRQVKLDGVRMELDEIESVLGRHPAVAQCAVTVADGERRRLTAHYVVRTPVSAEDLESYLHSRLPQALVPKRWDERAELPLTGNGKVDHRALAAGQGQES
ncbi:amino acid adenylation domain-containing protein [Saccharothrix tamanrassetensis]|uniref:Amino acid adenylation domain-containing protein n=1 Tax=Saccharothrix tamanrassetensis TaxID=1051531 RepID=A0A841CZI8_9PSEU|nr:amino acid adenylation domain-containing protein [Saccharothrix tamanrassetensis]MBB5960726.1 amino acid adenylation domain-containing protein [Saccharothrix tamanrassetensis]